MRSNVRVERAARMRGFASRGRLDENRRAVAQNFCSADHSNASSLAVSQSVVKIPAFPPNIVRIPPTMVMGNDRVRTVIPRTTPKDFTVRDPGISNVVDVSIHLFLTLIVATTGNKPAKQEPFKYDTQAIPPT